MATREAVARVIPGKPFCFLVAPGESDVFCHESQYPQGGLDNGDGVRFEWEKKSKGLAVKDGTTVVVLSKGNPLPQASPAPAAATQSAAPARTPSANRSQGPDVKVDFRFGTPRVFDHYFEMLVETSVEVDGNKDPKWVQVSLQTNGVYHGPAEKPQVVNGKAEFLVTFFNEETEPVLEVNSVPLCATVYYSGREFIFSYIWPPQTVSAPPPPPPPPPNLAAADKVDAQLIDLTSAGKFMVAVTTSAKGVKAPGKVQFLAAHEFEVSEVSGAVLVAGNSVSFETEGSGERIVLVDFTGTEKLSLKYRLDNGKGTYQDLILEKPKPSSAASAAAPTPPPEPDKLEVEVAAFPNASGNFLVTVRTLSTGGNPVQGEFTLVSADTLTVTETDGKVIQTGSLVSLKTQANGAKEFFFGYPGSGQILVTFKLSNGFKVSKNVTKKKLR